MWLGIQNVRLVKELLATFVAWFALLNAAGLVILLAMACRSTQDSFGVGTLLPMLSLTAFMDASPAAWRVKSAILQVTNVASAGRFHRSSTCDSCALPARPQVLHRERYLFDLGSDDPVVQIRAL